MLKLILISVALFLFSSLCYCAPVIFEELQCGFLLFYVCICLFFIFLRALKLPFILCRNPFPLKKMPPSDVIMKTLLCINIKMGKRYSIYWSVVFFSTQMNKDL